MTPFSAVLEKRLILGRRTRVIAAAILLKDFPDLKLVISCRVGSEEPAHSPVMAEEPMKKVLL